MKKVIFGSIMLLSGIIGMVGIMITVALTFEYQGDVISKIFQKGIQGIQALFFVLFISLALTGLGIGIIEAFTKEK